MHAKAQSPSSSLSAPNSEPALHRVVSGRMLLLLVVGDILGAGIYILVGDVAGEVGPSAWMAFMLTFSIAALSAASYSALVTRFPGPAGSALYVEKAFSRQTLTFVVGMAVMLSSLSTAATTTRAFAGQYLEEFVSLPVVAVALGVVVALTLLKIPGIEASARVNVGMTLIEVGGLIVVIVIGLAALLDGAGEPSKVASFEGLGMNGLLTATSLAFFAFLGFEDAVHLSAEVKDGRRVFPRVLFGAVAIASALYLAVVLVAVSNTSLFALVASSRLLYGMAEDGALPRGFARVHARYRTPVVACITLAVGAALLATTGAVDELAGAAVTLLLAVRTPADHRGGQ